MPPKKWSSRKEATRQAAGESLMSMHILHHSRADWGNDGAWRSVYLPERMFDPTRRLKSFQTRLIP